jgi:kynurenine formamidase
MAKQYIDITMDLSDAFSKFNPQSIEHFSPKLLGHVGTHIDIMNTNGLNIDRFISKVHLIEVAEIFERQITLQDTNVEHLNIEPGDSVIFKTNWSKIMFDSKEYFKNHPYLCYQLIDYLLEKRVNLIGIDAPGVRRGTEHHAIDQHCADHNVFIVENLVNLAFIDTAYVLSLYCFPLKFSKNTGVTCRVVVAINP